MWIMHLRNIIIYFVLVCLLSVALDGQLTDKQRRRFLRILLFPRGSSLQLGKSFYYIIIFLFEISLGVGTRFFG